MVGFRMSGIATAAAGGRRHAAADRTRSWVIALAAVTAGTTGCWKPPASMQAQAERGLVWIFPGIEGGEWPMAAAYQALRDAGIDGEIRVYNWWRLNPLANLTEYEHNRRRAVEIASEIVHYQRQHPGAPVDLIGYSGGGGLAVFVAEALPERARLRLVILVQAAISPDYDLRPALRRIDVRLVNLYSPLDALVLGVGTSVFGTMDRKNVSAAGSVGFDVERAVSDPSLRYKLEQVPWRLEALLTGHLGTHLGKAAYEWNRRYVVPYLTRAGERPLQGPRFADDIRRGRVLSGIPGGEN